MVPLRTPFPRPGKTASLSRFRSTLSMPRRGVRSSRRSAGRADYRRRWVRCGAQPAGPPQPSGRQPPPLESAVAAAAPAPPSMKSWRGNKISFSPVPAIPHSRAAATVGAGFADDIVTVSSRHGRLHPEDPRSKTCQLRSSTCLRSAGCKRPCLREICDSIVGETLNALRAAAGLSSRKRFFRDLPIDCLLGSGTRCEC